MTSQTQQDLDLDRESVALHAKAGGKIALELKVPLETQRDLSLAYSPGVAAVCRAIDADEDEARHLTVRGNSVAVVTDGSAVLGLGDIGPLAALPVMEGKAALFKRYADIDAWPLCLDVASTDELVATVRAIAPGFAGINLEDIAAPRCFEVEARLQNLGIPVFHDDQHGTAIVLLAALINACRVTGRSLSELKVVVAGAGAAGTAIARLLRCVEYHADRCTSVNDVVITDSRGVIHADRDDLNPAKRGLLGYTNRAGRGGTVHDALEGADVFVGVSRGGLLNGDDVRRMAANPILFPMANPEPEIDVNVARDAGAAIVGTGRSDLPNQVNNVLAFPGLFRGALDAGATRITNEMKLAAARALADCVPDPTPERVLPSPLEADVAGKVAQAVSAAWEEFGSGTIG